MSFEELMRDEEFARALDTVENDRQLLELLRSRGVEITEEELKKAYELMDKGEELDEEALEDVSGGFLGAAVALGIALAVLIYLRKKKTPRKK